MSILINFIVCVGDPVPESFAVQIFKLVSKFWSLGTVLGLEYTILDEIESNCQPNEHSLQVAHQACIKKEFSYEDLYRALRTPAVQDEATAKLVREKCSTVSTSRTSSSISDITTDGVSNMPTESGKHIVFFGGYNTS